MSTVSLKFWKDRSGKVAIRKRYLEFQSICLRLEKARVSTAVYSCCAQSGDLPFALGVESDYREEKRVQVMCKSDTEPRRAFRFILRDNDTTPFPFVG